MKKSQSSEEFSKINYIEFKERVRYSECDRMGVAHNKNYLEWFEIGRTEFCHRKNISYKNIESQGYYLVVVEAFCRYKKPLRYDDSFIIRVSLREATPRKVVFHYELLTIDKKELVASGYTVHVATDSKAKVCSLPLEILDKLKQ